MKGTADGGRAPASCGVGDDWLCHTGLMSAAELPGSPSPSVVGEPFTWSTSASVAYEVALEVLGEMVAISAAEVWAEEHADAPDPDRLRRAQQTQARYAGQRRSLRLGDGEEIARVTREYGAILRQRRST